MADPSFLEAKLNFSTAFAQVLDKRILKALGEMGFARPTLIQTQAIPIALEGRDILARARTGSGKTAAYCIPMVQKILQAKAAEIAHISLTRALILAPTKELCEQVAAYLRRLLIYCDKTVRIANIAGGASGQIQRMLLADVPDIVIGTPTRVLALLQSKTLSLGSLETLVIDEADLILSYGHDSDVRSLLSGDFLPKVYQSLLMSATMTEDVQILKGLVLRNPAIIKLEETQDEAANLAQYFVKCNEVDKFLLVYVILKLKLVQGKCILFVNSVDRCYRLKLFLEQFSIRSCVLNPELPINSRFHIVQEFNKGIYDYIIASDESGSKGENDGASSSEDEGEDGDEEESIKGAEDVAAVDEDKVEAGAPPEEQVSGPDSDKENEDESDADAEATAEAGPSTSKKRKPSPGAASSPPASKRPKPNSQKKKTSQRGPATDKEFGVSRGVDFVDVACVINFDLPMSSRGYTHRIGRTARAGRSGLAISFIVPSSEWNGSERKNDSKSRAIVSLASTRFDEKVFRRIEKEQGARGSKIKEYEFDMAQVEAFRYRMEDALRSVTKGAIKEAKVKELKSEILNSDRLKAHFEDNPQDLDYLRHDKPLRPTRIQAHMRHVPKYLVPRIASVPSTTTPSTSASNQPGAPDLSGKVDSTTKDVGFVPFRKDNGRGRGRGRGRGGHRGGANGGGRKKKDPLRKFGK